MKSKYETEGWGIEYKSGETLWRRNLWIIEDRNVLNTIDIFTERRYT